MGSLRLAAASAIVHGTLAEARQRGLAPLGVAVLDAGGHLLAFEREDGASFLRFDIACGKAWGALGMGFGTRELTERAATSPAFVAALSAMTGGRMVPSPGGVLIVGPDGEVVGAAGVSGDAGDNDEACVVAAIEAAGFAAVAGRRDG